MCAALHLRKTSRSGNGQSLSRRYCKHSVWLFLWRIVPVVQVLAKWPGRMDTYHTYAQQEFKGAQISLPRKYLSTLEYRSRSIFTALLDMTLICNAILHHFAGCLLLRLHFFLSRPFVFFVQMRKIGVVIPYYLTNLLTSRPPRGGVEETIEEVRPQFVQEFFHFFSRFSLLPLALALFSLQKT